MLVYSWPQINLSGKFNPPLYHPSLFIPAYEHNRMPRSGDSRQPMKDERECCFFPVLHGNGRQENSPSMQAAIGASAGPFGSLSCAHIHTDLSKPRSAREPHTGGSVRFLSLSFLSVSFFTFLDTNLKPLMRGPSGMVPVHFLDKVWTKCQQFPVHPHSHTLTAKDERPKGQISWQQGDVLRSIVPLSRIWRCQTLKIRLIQTLVTLIVQ